MLLFFMIVFLSFRGFIETSALLRVLHKDEPAYRFVHDFRLACAINILYVSFI